jgi:hypothetical protein
MSQMGQTRHFGCVPITSGLPATSDVALNRNNRRYVPPPDMPSEPIRESCRTGRHTPAQPRPRLGLRTSPPWPTLLAGHPSPIRPRTVTLWLHPQRPLQLSVKSGFLVFGGLTNNVDSRDGVTQSEGGDAISPSDEKRIGADDDPPCDSSQWCLLSSY